MAVAIGEGFSIREYTAKMRAVDAGKCWPFGASGGGGDPVENETNEQRLEALLPPITIVKFRWWSHEILELQEQGVVGIPINDAKDENEEKLEILYPVCGNFVAANMKAFNAHVDSCLAHAQGEKTRNMKMLLKAKSKSPKKRSIIEIFAVSPQIERVDDDDDDGLLHVQDDGVLDVVKTKHDKQKRKKVKINKQKIKKAAIANNLTMNQKNNKSKRNKLKMKKMNNNKRPIASKASAMKLNLPNPVNCRRKVYDSFYSKGVANDILDDGSIQTSKLAMQGSRPKKRRGKASKFIAKHRNAVIPVCGILKNNTKLIPRENSEILNLPGGSQINCCELQHTDRHVRFSCRDDILGPGKDLSSNIQNVFDTCQHVLPSQLEHEYSTANDKQSVSGRGSGMVDVSVSTGDGIVLQTKISKNQLPVIPDPVGMLDFLSPYRGKEQHISGRSTPSQVVIEDNSLHMLAKGYQNAPQNPTYAGILRVLPTANEANNPHVNSQFYSNPSMGSNPRGKSVYFEDHKHEFAAGGLWASTRASVQPSSCEFASFDSAVRRVSIMPESSIKCISGQSLLSQPIFHLSPMDFMGSDSDYQQGIGALSEKCIDEEFCGLPLNSRGELIQVSSCAKVDFQQPKKSSLISSSESSSHNSVLPRSLGDFVSEKHLIEQAVAKDHLSFLPLQKNHNVQIPARFGVNELPNTERQDIDLLNSESRTNNSVYPLDSRPSVMNFSFNQWRQYGQVQSQKGSQMIHLKKNSDNIALKPARPIMRLMGKDVAIGRNNTDAGF